MIARPWRDWVGRATRLLEPLSDAIGRMVRRSPAVFADDTPVKLQTPGQKGMTTARVWAYVADQRGSGGTAPPCAWYRFTSDRKAEHPAEHLCGFKGHVHADGYIGLQCAVCRIRYS